jgi:AcrR family transcriptional regulator
MGKKVSDSAIPAPIPVPPWRTPPKPAPTRQPLSQELIVDTALRILDSEGLDAVTMRRVAQELDTGPASLYAHVANKEELQHLMLDRVAGEIEVPEPDPERWQEQVKEYARACQKVWTAHADIARISLGTVPTGPNSMRAAEGMLAILKAGGVPDQVAAWTLDRMGLYIDGDAYEAGVYIAREKTGFDAEAYFGQVREYFESLPKDRFPLITSMVDSLMAGDGDERFEFGIDLFVRGLASYAAEAKSS